MDWSFLIRVDVTVASTSYRFSCISHYMEFFKGNTTSLYYPGLQIKGLILQAERIELKLDWNSLLLLRKTLPILKK